MCLNLGIICLLVLISYSRFRSVQIVFITTTNILKPINIKQNIKLLFQFIFNKNKIMQTYLNNTFLLVHSSSNASYLFIVVFKRLYL